MTEEKLRKAYRRGRSYTREIQAKKSCPNAKNPVEAYFKEFLNSTVYKQEILPNLREMAGYQDINDNGRFQFPPDGMAEYLLDDCEESFRMGMLDGLLDRKKLEKIDHR